MPVHTTLLISKPTTLRDVGSGDFFVVQYPGLMKSVCALARGIQADSDSVHVVVIASAAQRDAAEFLPAGQLLTVPDQTSVVVLDQVAPASFHERDRPLSPELRRELEERQLVLRQQYEPL